VAADELKILNGAIFADDGGKAHRTLHASLLG
jgi:hypothetical protein